VKWLLLAVVLLGGCEKAPVKPLAIEAYIWQRPDRADVLQAAKDSADFISIHHVRAAELKWQNGRFLVDEAVTVLPAFRCGLVVRIGASASGLDWTAEQVAPVAEVFGKLAALGPVEIQCDFDCPQSRLANYSGLLEILRKRCGKVPVVPTALPSWLDEPEFAKLIAGLDPEAGYVLQVHSLVLPKNPGEAPVIFDEYDARGYAKKAAALGTPFRIAMATYGCEVRFGADGKVIDVVSEDTGGMNGHSGRRGFALADPVSSAKLVREWGRDTPNGMSGIIWYRLPISSDSRNWPMGTLRMVARGDTVDCAAELVFSGESAARDIFMANAGAFPVNLPERFTISSPVKAADGAGGYRMEREGERIVFRLRGDVWPWLDPGKKVACGWMIPSDGSVEINSDITR
jgi:hypothetical protein